MKKITLLIMIAFLTLAVSPNTISAKTIDPVPVTANATEVPENVQIMLNRLDEIKAMDKTNLSSSEKRALRKEVRGIRSELSSSRSGGGIYLSVGAIIIIILLLILLL